MIVHGQAVVDWVAKNRGYAGGYSLAVGIGVAATPDASTLRGAVVYHEYSGASVRVHVASDGSRRWVTREWLHVIFMYAFDQLKVKRITGMVPEANTAALNFDKSVGFVEEARMKDADPGGDVIILKMTRDMCRWINYAKFPNGGNNV